MPMSDEPSYRGFEMSTFTRSRGPATTTFVKAERGPIRILVHGDDQTQMPHGWTLRDVVERQVDQLIDPKALRGVEKLN